MTDLHLRDLAWAMIDPDDAEQHARVWMQVVNQVPPTLSAAPLALLGMAAWIAGDGALQNCCCDELARLHPRYSMGGLLSTHQRPGSVAGAVAHPRRRHAGRVAP